jgi:hypothetical protein
VSAAIGEWFFPIVPFWTPNKLRGKHWGVAKKSADEWRHNVGAICGRAKNPCTGRRRLEITVSRPRRLDPDNETAALKPVIDALKRAGWIKNDSPKWLVLVVVQVRDKTASMRIELRDAFSEPKPYGYVVEIANDRSSSTRSKSTTGIFWHDKQFAKDSVEDLNAFEPKRSAMVIPLYRAQPAELEELRILRAIEKLQGPARMTDQMIDGTQALYEELAAHRSGKEKK